MFGKHAPDPHAQGGSSQQREQNEQGFALRCHPRGCKSVQKSRCRSAIDMAGQRSNDDAGLAAGPWPTAPTALRQEADRSDRFCCKHDSAATPPGVVVLQYAM